MPQLTLAQAFARSAPKKSSNSQLKSRPKSPPPPPKAGPLVAPAAPVVKILFGPTGPYADLNQFSPHTVEYQGTIYPTSQHLFQAFKFLGHRDDIAEKIRRADTPGLAFDIAHGSEALVRPDWRSMNLNKMEDVILMKFSQHLNLQQQLLATGNAELYQDSTTDSFWGVGSDLLGSNHLGQILERVRESLGGAKAPERTVLQCQNCRKKPRLAKSMYCGNTCLRADLSRTPPLCPVTVSHPLSYCFLDINSNVGGGHKSANSSIVAKLVAQRLLQS